jgi:hypothetical protein
MCSRCFVLALLALAVSACDKKEFPGSPTSPTTTSTTTTSSLPQEIRIQVARIADQEVGVRVWGAVRKGSSVNPDESIVMILLYDRTCSDQRKYQNGYGAPNNPIDGTDSAYFPHVRVCGNMVNFALGVQTNTRREPKHTLDDARISPSGANGYNRVSEGGEWRVKGSLR